MGTHVSINAQKLCCKLLTIAGFPSTLRSSIESEMCQQALSSVHTKFILLIGVRRKYHDLMLQNNKTRGPKVRETYLA